MVHHRTEVATPKETTFDVHSVSAILCARLAS